jgi:hypothetical protein
VLFSFFFYYLCTLDQIYFTLLNLLVCASYCERFTQAIWKRITTSVSANINVVTSSRLNGSTADSVATDAKLFGIENPAFGAGNLAIFLRGIWDSFTMWYIQWMKKYSEMCLIEVKKHILRSFWHVFYWVMSRIVYLCLSFFFPIVRIM